MQSTVREIEAKQPKYENIKICKHKQKISEKVNVKHVLDDNGDHGKMESRLIMVIMVTTGWRHAQCSLQANEGPE